MWENESKRHINAERIANEAKATWQATWDLMAHMKRITLLQTEHGPMLPNTDVRTKAQETCYHYWTEMKPDPNAWRTTSPCGNSHALTLARPSIHSTEKGCAGTSDSSCSEETILKRKKGRNKKDPFTDGDLRRRSPCRHSIDRTTQENEEIYVLNGEGTSSRQDMSG